MAQTRDQAIARAKADLSKRLGIAENQISENSIENAEFPDMSLGAPQADEMSAQMISPGWKIRLHAAGQNYEYRADNQQLRLIQFKGANHLVSS